MHQYLLLCDYTCLLDGLGLAQPWTWPKFARPEPGLPAYLPGSGPVALGFRPDLRLFGPNGLHAWKWDMALDINLSIWYTLHTYWLSLIIIKQTKKERRWTESLIIINQRESPFSEKQRVEKKMTFNSTYRQLAKPPTTSTTTTTTRSTYREHVSQWFKKINPNPYCILSGGFLINRAFDKGEKEKKEWDRLIWGLSSIDLPQIHADHHLIECPASLFWLPLLPRR